MTSTIEPGSREDYLRMFDEGVELAHSREWYEADGYVTMSDSDMEMLDHRQTLLRVEPLAIPANGYMLDYSGARPNLTVAKQTGAKVIARYISAPTPSTAWKRIGPGERDNILKIIGDLWLNWEWYAGRMLEGKNAGAEDGRWALAAVEALSYPRGRIIPASHDTGANNDAAVAAYCAAFNRALGGSYKLTVYGGFHTCELLAGKNGVQPITWQTKAWSGTSISASAGPYQNTRQWFNGTVDENDIRKVPFGTWNHPYPPVTPPPPPSPGGAIDFTKVVGMYASQAAFETAVRTQARLGALDVETSALWGDGRGLTPEQMQLVTHGRASLGVYDAMSAFSRGKFIKFSKDPKVPSAIYAWNGNDKLVWISASELGAIQRVASPDPKGSTYNYALMPVVDMPIDGNIFKLGCADGTIDPRVTPVTAQELDYNPAHIAVIPFPNDEVDVDEDA